MTTLKPKPLWRPLDSLRGTMVKQVFAREHFTHKKGLQFTPTVHTDEGMAERGQWPAHPLAADAADEVPPANAHPAQAEPSTASEAPNTEEIRAQAFAEGLAQGLAQAQQQALENEAADAQEALAAQAHAQTQALLQEIDHKVDGLKEDPALLQEPLKRLALHLAEQLVLAELNLSPQAVEQLIERCMDTLDAADASAVVVELNPQDWALLQKQQRAHDQPKPAWRWQADQGLLPGSVRVRADDAVVSDLIENRLESLAHSLLKDPQAWQANSAFSPSKLASRLAAQRGSADTVEDALAKPLMAKSSAAFEGLAQTPFNAESAVRDEPFEAADAFAQGDDLDEKHTYEAHEVMQAAPQSPPQQPKSPPEAMTPSFHETLNDIQLELDKLDD